MKNHELDDDGASSCNTISSADERDVDMIIGGNFKNYFDVTQECKKLALNKEERQLHKIILKRLRTS